MIRWLSIAVGAGVVGLIALLATGGGTTDTTSPLVGRRAPLIAGVTTAGEVYDIDNARGRWVIINVFGSWCPPCVDEHPELVELSEWGTATGQAELVSIAFQDTAEGVAGFFDRYGGEWPVLNDSQLALELGVAQVPETFLVSPGGIVVAHWGGPVTAEAVAATIDVLASGADADGGGG